MQIHFDADKYNDNTHSDDKIHTGVFLNSYRINDLQL